MAGFYEQLKSLDKKIAALRAETRYMQGDDKNDAELKRLEQVSDRQISCKLAHLYTAPTGTRGAQVRSMLFCT